MLAFLFYSIYLVMLWLLIMVKHQRAVMQSWELIVNKSFSERDKAYTLLLHAKTFEEAKTLNRIIAIERDSYSRWSKAVWN